MPPTMTEQSLADPAAASDELICADQVSASPAADTSALVCAALPAPYETQRVTAPPVQDTALLYTPASPSASGQAQDADDVARLEAALTDAYVAVFGTAGGLLASMVNTMRADPGTYLAHVVTGAIGCVWEQLKGMADFVVKAGEAVVSAATCAFASAGQTLGAYAAWATDPSADLPTLDLPPSCIGLSNGLNSVTDAVRAATQWVSEASPTSIVAMASEAFGKALCWVRDLHLLDRLTALVSDAAGLGSFHGALIGMAAVTLVQPEGVLLEIVQGEGLVGSAIASADAVGAISRDVFSAVHSTESVAVSADVLVQESSQIAKAAGKLLRETKTTRFYKLDGEAMQAFEQAVKRPEVTRALTGLYQTLVAELSGLRSEVGAYSQMKNRLVQVNRMTKTMILSEVSSVGIATDELATAAALSARLRAEEELFEAAHVVDWRLLDKASPQLQADFRSLGWVDKGSMPAFAAPRAEHRTTLALLEQFGATVPNVEAQTITNQMMTAIVTTSSTSASYGSEVLVISEATRGYEVVRKTGAVYESKFPLTAWETTHETLFSSYKQLIGEFAGTPKYAELVKDWPSFAAWLGK